MKERRTVRSPSPLLPSHVRAIAVEAFTSDPDRLARFEREAKVLASLNHPTADQPGAIR